MNIEKALGKLRAAQMCHPNAVQALIDEAIAAIQQAEAQPPDTGEPVLTVEREPNYWSHGHCYEGNKPHINPIKIWSLPIGTKLYTHPAPSVPDDVVRDAERYRWLRDHDHWPAPFSSSQEPEPVRGRDLDAAIDAAMLAAKERLTP